MPIKIKRNGAYVDATVMLKKGGIYVPANLMLKNGGIYTAVNSAAKLPADSKVAYVGDSISAGGGATSTPLALAEMLATGAVMRYPLNFNQSLSGQTTDWLVSAPVLAAVNALGAKVVRIHIGTNDYTATSNNPQKIADNLAAAAASFTAGGTELVIIDQIAPRADTAFLALSGARQADLAATNPLIAALASTKIKILTVPATFNTATHCMPDLLHFNDLGGQLWATSCQAIVAANVDESVDIRTLYLDATNLLLAAGNPQLTGTAGSKTAITGQVADGWAAAAAVDGTMTVVASKVANFNGAIGQRLDISGTPATAGRNISVSRTVTMSGNIGDQFEAWIDFQLDAGSTGFRNPGLLLSIPSETGGDTPGRGGLIVRTQPMAGTMRASVSGALTAARTSIGINFVATFDTGALSAGLTFGRPMIRKVV